MRTRNKTLRAKWLSPARRYWGRVAIAVVMVAPWLLFALMRSPAPDPNLVAIPLSSKDITGPLAPNFAAAKYFALVDLRTQGMDFVDNGSPLPGATLGIDSAHRLVGRGVGAVVAQQISPAARNALYSRGVRVFGSGAASGLTAIQLMRTGSLAEFGGARAPWPSSAGAPNSVAVVPPAGVAVAGTPTPLGPQPGMPAAGPGAGQGMGYGRGAGTPSAVVAPSLGVQVATAPAGGVTVLGVQAGSRAARGGIRVGEVIVAVGQNQVRSSHQFERLVSRATQTDSLFVLVARNGAFLQVWAPP